MRPKRHLVIPDCQVKPGVNTDHLEAIGNYIAEKGPDEVICLGDFADMPSLNGYVVGKAEAEGKRYVEDIRYTKDAMQRLLMPVRQLPHKRRPNLVLTMGNHEERIDREAEANPKWKGFLSTKDLGYEQFGWNVHRFLDVAILDGIQYSHYFVGGVMGRPVSSASALMRQRQSSAVMGHVQRVDQYWHPVTQKVALFAGICYTHDEAYLTPQGQNTKRGIWVLNEVINGTFDPMFVSLDYLKRKYL